MQIVIRRARSNASESSLVSGQSAHPAPASEHAAGVIACESTVMSVPIVGALGSAMRTNSLTLFSTIPDGGARRAHAARRVAAGDCSGLPGRPAQGGAKQLSF